MNKRILFFLAGAAVVASSCTMAPKYDRPTTAAPPEWPKGEAYEKAASSTTVSNVAQLRWQEFFSDEKLRRVIGMAIENNRDLRIAILNVERARGLYGVQKTDLYPTIDATGKMNQTHNPADLSSSGVETTSSRYDVNLGVASWELDLSGRVRSLKESALQSYLATEYASRGAQISLISSVASACLVLAADQENLALARTTLAAQEHTYQLIKRRHELGLVSELDLFRVQTQVDNSRQDIAMFKQRVAQDENALTLLVGKPVPPELLPPQLGEINPTRDLAPGLPSDVLLNRPDILEAEATLKSSYADMGAARSSFFPRISLTAAMGTASSDLGNLFKNGYSAWNFTPQIIMPIFDARTWYAYKTAKAQQQIAVTQYEKAIQSAFKDVADALATRGTIDEQLAAQQSLVNAVSETYRLANSRYDKGIDNYLSVLDAQRSLYAAQQGLVSLRLSKLANNVKLYAVLGGGQPDPKERKSEDKK